MVLHGRVAELGDIDELLADARAGHSSMQVIQGEAGSGKTALLEHVASDAKDFRVLRCTQTLDESFSLHIDLALAARAGDEQIRAVLLLVAEYGIAKAWRPHRALAAR